jgi:cell wall-associated NlpC family hydrolase
MRDSSTVADNAVAWAKARLGSTSYATRCLAFVEDAIERANGIEIFGGDDARESAVLYGAHTRAGDAAPPVGALVFYDSVSTIRGQRRNWGHVGLSLGDGAIIHAWDRVRIDGVWAVEQLTPPPGGEPWSFVGWVPLSRVLEGSVPKAYADEDAADAAVRAQRERFG